MGLTHWSLITDPREKYQAYLCSEEWGKLRLAVRLLSHGKCERCGLGAVEHTHHLTYIRRFKEELRDLVGLCEPCHNIVHGWQGKRTLTTDDKMRLLAAQQRAEMRCRAIDSALKQVEPIAEPLIQQAGADQRKIGLKDRVK